MRHRRDPTGGRVCPAGSGQRRGLLGRAVREHDAGGGTLMTRVHVGQRSEVAGRPRFEGSNICTWIGFKHIMYLIEDAVLTHLRAMGSVPRLLYEREALGVE